MSPFEVGIAGVYRDRTAGAAGGSVDTGGAGVGKEVEKVGSLGFIAEHSPSYTVIEKNPGIQVVGEIDKELQAPFLDDVSFSLAVAAFVLIAPLLTTALLYIETLRVGPVVVDHRALQLL